MANFGPSIQLTGPDPKSSTFDDFVTRLDSSGHFIWADGLAVGTTDQFTGQTIAVDSQDDVFVTGSYSTNATLGSIQLPLTGFANAFVTELNGAGHVVWAQSIGVDPQVGKFAGEAKAEAFAVATDDQGGVYVTGYFQSLTDFGPTIQQTASTQDAFVCKLDDLGTFQWVDDIVGSNNDFGDDGGTGLTADSRATSTHGGLLRLCRIRTNLPECGKGDLRWIRVQTGFLRQFSLGQRHRQQRWHQSLRRSRRHRGGRQRQRLPHRELLRHGPLWDHDDPDDRLGRPGRFREQAGRRRELPLGQRRRRRNSVNAFGSSIAADASANLYFTGGFNGTADFDLGAGVDNLTTSPYFSDVGSNFFLSRTTPAVVRGGAAMPRSKPSPESRCNFMG